MVARARYDDDDDDDDTISPTPTTPMATTHAIPSHESPAWDIAEASDGYYCDDNAAAATPTSTLQCPETLEGTLRDLTRNVVPLLRELAFTGGHNVTITCVVRCKNAPPPLRSKTMSFSASPLNSPALYWVRIHFARDTASVPALCNAEVRHHARSLAAGALQWCEHLGVPAVLGIEALGEAASTHGVLTDEYTRAVHVL